MPDASTISQHRRRCFNNSEIYQDIFDEIVEQAIRVGLIDGTVLYSDNTHLKASANKNKFDRHVVEKSRADYLAALILILPRIGPIMARSRSTGSDGHHQSKSDFNHKTQKHWSTIQYKTPHQKDGVRQQSEAPYGAILYVQSQRD